MPKKATPFKQPTSKPDNILGSEVLDHLGLVAATIDKLGIVKHIDKHMPLGTQAKTTFGQRAAAMIMNGLGFIDDRLYMFPKFLENKPVDILFGDDLCAEDFNDDCLGRFLDAVHEYGETKLFSEIALPIALEHKMLNNSIHLDTISLTVYGEYDKSREESATIESNNAYPEFGHAKNKRTDLKQMVLLTATTGKAAFPIWMESHSGNASDKKTLEEAASRMQKLCDQLALSEPLLFVGDSAMYANCVKKGKDLLWLSRVPENMNLSKDLITQKEVPWVELTDGYKIFPIDKNYGGVQQRWLLVFSQHAYTKEIATLEKNITKEFDMLNKQLWHLGNETFGCKQDAILEIKKLSKVKFHKISYSIATISKYGSKGRPKKNTTPDKIEYQIKAVATINKTKIDEIKLTKGRFILATNQLDKIQLPDTKILPTYKEQSGNESGFKFIKDDTFELDSIFLKKPERIQALMMIMVLCLMVYSFAQYFLRQQLALNQETIKSQSGKDTKNPSMKWVFRLFHGVHVLRIKLQEQIHGVILNMNQGLSRIVSYFGDFACSIYDIPRPT